MYLVAYDPEIFGIAFAAIVGFVIGIGPSLMTVVYRNTKWGKSELKIASARLDILIAENIDPLVAEIESMIQRDAYGNIIKDEAKHAIKYFLKVKNFKSPIMPKPDAIFYIRQKLGYD